MYINNKLYKWCLEQASQRYCGMLEQDKIEKLNSIGFDWVYWENELDKFGYCWELNNPNGVRYKDIKDNCIIAQTLDITGYIIALEIENQRLKEKIEYLSMMTMV